MSDLELALRQVRFENRSFWRNPAAVFFTFVMSLMFLVIFTGIFGNDPLRVEGGVIKQSTFYVPAIAALSIISACYTSVAIGLTFSRDQGVLKRVRGTPLPAWTFIFGRVVQATFVGLLLLVLVTLVGAVFYEVDVPTDTMPAVIVTVLVGSAAFASLGIAMTGFVPNAEAAPPVVNASILPLLFISDVFIPLEDAPQWLATVGDLFPVKHFSDALQTAYSPFTTDTGFEGVDLLVIALWGIAGVVIASRYFSWEPRR